MHLTVEKFSLLAVAGMILSEALLVTFFKSRFLVSLLTNLLEKWSPSTALFRQIFFESYFTGVGVHLSNVTLTRYQTLFVSCLLVLFHIICLFIHSNVALTLKNFSCVFFRRWQEVTR